MAPAQASAAIKILPMRVHSYRQRDRFDKARASPSPVRPLPLLRPATGGDKLPVMPIAESLDHFVVPVDDLVAAEEFYARVFDGQITKRNGLNVRQRRRGAVPHTFIKIGGKRMGVYLQSDYRPEPEGARGL